MSILRRLRVGVAALVAVASVSPAAAATVLPKPAVPRAAAKNMLFRVRAANGGATVYLVGSVHLLSADAAKLPASVDSAFAKAGVVAFETSPDSVQMRAMELLARGRYANGATLRSSISPAAAAKVDSLLRGYGLSIDQLNQFKPWVVTMMVGQLAMQKANFKAEFGVDMQLNRRAKEANKPIVGLEPVDFQLGLFDSIAPEDQEQMLLQLSPADSNARQLTVIKDAWSEGNTARLDSLLNSSMGHSKRLFATLITDRNRNWIPKIEQMLRGKDDALVVVGAGHLVGREGVVELLKAKGYTVEQM